MFLSYSGQVNIDKGVLDKLYKYCKRFHKLKLIFKQLNFTLSSVYLCRHVLYPISRAVVMAMYSVLSTGQLWYFSCIYPALSLSGVHGCLFV